MKLNFKDFFPIETYKQIVEVELSEKPKDNPDYDKIFAKHKLFEESILSYLKDRASKSMLNMPINSGTHYSNFLSQWEHLVKGELKPHEEERVTYVFSKLISNDMMKLTYAKEPVSVEQSYENFIEKINKGDFVQYEIDCDSTCLGCDQRIKLIAKDWNFKLITLDYNEEKKYTYKLMVECVEDKLQEVKVEFKTGELLIADWFRIPEFTKQVEYDPDYTKVGINSDLGQIRSTEHSANLGFITVHVGNSSPTIFQQGDNLIFGREDEESEIESTHNYQDKGYVCTDLWNVTIIDKSRLIEIVEQKLGHEKAVETVEQYIVENKDNMNFINVEPGNYVIGFYPRKNINKFDCEIPQEVETKFTMRKELPKKKLKM